MKLSRIILQSLGSPNWFQVIINSWLYSYHKVGYIYGTSLMPFAYRQIKINSSLFFATLIWVKQWGVNVLRQKRGLEPGVIIIVIISETETPSDWWEVGGVEAGYVCYVTLVVTTPTNTQETKIYPLKQNINNTTLSTFWPTTTNNVFNISLY